MKQITMHYKIVGCKNLSFSLDITSTCYKITNMLNDRYSIICILKIAWQLAIKSHGVGFVSLEFLNVRKSRNQCRNSAELQRRSNYNLIHRNHDYPSADSIIAESVLAT